MEDTPSQSEVRRYAAEVAATLRFHAHRAYLVGGCVRDRLLGVLPKDYDIATDATPQQVTGYFKRANLVGAHFGVVLVQAPQAGVHIEVATFRSDGVYQDGRRPDRVTFETDPKADALRRDFTVNALFEDPATGAVLDFVNGQNDLRDCLIRAIGDPVQRFTEDRLRMLRAVRFAARLEFEIEPATLTAIRQLAPKIHEISAERSREELSRILTEPHPKRGLELLDRTGLLAELLPEVKALQGVEQPPQFHPEGDVWVHTLMMLDMMRLPSRCLAWGVLLHDIGKPPTFRVADRIRFDGHAEVGARMAAEIGRRLKFSGGDTDTVTALVANHMKFKDVSQMRASTRKRFMQLAEFAEHLELHRMDCLASHGNLEIWESLSEELAHEPAPNERPAPILTGKDLIAGGFKPGKKFGQVLHDVETAHLDGQISTKEQALALARELMTSDD